MSSMEERLDRTTEAWYAEKDDKLMGDVIDRSTMNGEFGDYPIVVIRTDREGCTETHEGKHIPITLGDERAFHAFRTVAKNEILKQDPVVGDKIGIKCLGPMMSKGGQEFISYKVIVEKPKLEDKLDVPSETEDSIPF